MLQRSQNNEEGIFSLYLFIGTKHWDLIKKICTIDQIYEIHATKKKPSFSCEPLENENEDKPGTKLWILVNKG